MLSGLGYILYILNGRLTCDKISRFIHHFYFSDNSCSLHLYSFSNTVPPYFTCSSSNFLLLFIFFPSVPFVDFIVFPSPLLPSFTSSSYFPLSLLLFPSKSALPTSAPPPPHLLLLLLLHFLFLLQLLLMLLLLPLSVLFLLLLLLLLLLLSLFPTSHTRLCVNS